MIRSLLLPLDATFICAEYFSRLDILDLGRGGHILGCGNARVRGSLLQCRGEKRGKGSKHYCE